MDTARGRFGEDFQKLRCQSPADVIIQSDGHQCLFSLLSHSSFSISTTDTHLFVHVIFSRAKMDKRVHCSCWIQSSRFLDYHQLPPIGLFLFFKALF
ncbi:uncharacterized protein LOC144819585 isoform X2 [Lissotriton helveticus]